MNQVFLERLIRLKTKIDITTQLIWKMLHFIDFPLRFQGDARTDFWLFSFDIFSIKQFTLSDGLMFVLFGLHLILFLYIWFLYQQCRERWLVCWLFEQSVSNIYNLLFIMRDPLFAFNSIVSFNFIEDHQLFMFKRILISHSRRT